MNGETVVSAAVSSAPGKEFEFQELRLDAPRPDEVLVRIHAVGVCHTDAVVLEGRLPTPFPIVLGHEGAGVVEAAGADVSSLEVGDRVALSYAACGTCRSCRRGARSAYSEFFRLNFSGTRADGSTALRGAGGPVHSHFFGQSSFATHAVCHARSAVKLPEALPMHLAAPLGCSMLTGAGSVLRSLDVREGDSIAVLGTGAVGMAAIMAAASRHASTVIAVDRDRTRVELAARLGASHTVCGTSPDELMEQIRAVAAGGVDHILDTTGNMELISAGIRTLNTGGTCAVVGGAPSPDATLSVAYRDLLLGAKRIVGVIEGDADPQEVIPELIDLHFAGVFPLAELVTTFPFEDLNVAMAAGAAGSVIKPVVLPC